MYDFSRNDKKVQPTEVHIDDVQKEFGYNYSEARIYAYYYNMLNAVRLKNSTHIASNSEYCIDAILEGYVSFEKAKEIVKKAEKDFDKLYPSY